MKLQKLIDDADEPGNRRRYDDACGAAHALELVGERWALLVIREMLFGPRRFGDLRADLPGISANVLSQRLDGLERVGIVARRRLPPPASVQVYELTPWGQESAPIFAALGRWAARSPGHDPSLPLSATSLLLSFTTMFDAARATDLTAEIGIRTPQDSYRISIRGGTIAAARGTSEGADLIFVAEPRTIAAMVYGGQPLTALERAGMLEVEGDRALAERFVGLFSLPAKVGA